MYDLSNKKIVDEAKKYHFESLDDRELFNLASEIRENNPKGIKGNKAVAAAAALVKECVKRVLGISLFDVQLMAGLALYEGKIVQMNTGEGKTVSTILPVLLNCLDGKKVHILTFNDYLAKRDANWMGAVYEKLGIKVGFIQEDMAIEQRRKAYAADVLYVSAKEVGYDYLRDALAYKEEDLLQGRLEVVIVDEADSILIDEARVPLVIADISEGSEEGILKAVDMVKNMEKGLHYDTDENCRSVYFTEAGDALLESIYHYKNLYAQENICHLMHLNNALQAIALLERDVHYIVKDGTIGIIDEFTGRVVENRHWPDCLQAAVEAKEGLEIHSRGRVMNSITIQNFIRLYEKISGMTGTAEFSRDEFYSYYGLEVEVIPPNLECVRKDIEDVVFTHKEAKYTSIVDEVVKWHNLGRPVLIGTGSVMESEKIAELLEKKRISLSVLNAKNDNLEAEVIAEAGRVGAVTVSTNMAGRGTDIKLGGSSEGEKKMVVGLGGMYVIGTTRHESRRIDFQLRGRAGRQGEPGETRFFISLEDDILKQYGIEKMMRNKLMPKQETPISSKKIVSKILQVQRIIEGQNYEIRKTLWSYNVMVDLQRRYIYDKRKQVLESDNGLELFSLRCKKKYEEAIRLCDSSEVIKLQKGIMLHSIDQCWASYLDMITYLREGIYLMVIGGQNPLEVFNRQLFEAFEELKKDIEETAVRIFERVKIEGHKLIYDESMLKGPSSTWTYLVGDNPFSNDLGIMLTNSKNTGFGAIAAIASGPLLVGSLIYQRFFKKNRALK